MTFTDSFGRRLPALPPIASAGVHSGWASDDLARVYAEIERIKSTMHKLSTESGCLSSALAAVELADEYVAKSQRES